MSNVKGGCSEGALFGESRGGEKVLEAIFSAIDKKRRAEDKRLLKKKNETRPEIRGNGRQSIPENGLTKPWAAECCLSSW